MAHTITIYAKTTCQYCDKLKKYLDMKGHAYTVINIDNEPERQQEVFDLGGGVIVPFTVIKKGDGTKNVVSGFNLQNLVPLLAS